MREDTARTHRDLIIDLACDTLETNTATMLTDYQAMMGLISMVAGPGGHVEEAIELVTERRDEALAIARRELEQMSARPARLHEGPPRRCLRSPPANRERDSARSGSR